MVLDPSNHPISINSSTHNNLTTAWVAAILLMVLGASRGAIVKDYLHSNIAYKASMHSSSTDIEPLMQAETLPRMTMRAKDMGLELQDEGVNYSEMAWSMVVCQKEYIEAALDAVDKEFGGVAGYLEAIGIDHRQQETFRAAMLI